MQINELFPALAPVDREAFKQRKISCMSLFPAAFGSSDLCFSNIYLFMARKDQNQFDQRGFVNILKEFFIDTEDFLYVPFFILSF